MVKANFQHLPQELFDTIAKDLSISSIYSLRLLSRDISTKATKCEIFHSCFQNFRLELSRRRLTSLALLTQDVGLAQRVRNLTIVGRAYRTARPGGLHGDHSTLTGLEKQQADDTLVQRQGLDSSLLTTIFSNLVLSNSRDLDTISMVIVVYMDDSNPPVVPRDAVGISPSIISQACLDTFSSVVLALQETSLSFRALDLFKSGPAGFECGVPSIALSPSTWKASLTTHTFSTLRSLAISVAEMPLPPHSSEARRFDVLGTDIIKNSVDLTRLIALLRACSNLEEAYITPYRQHDSSNTPIKEQSVRLSHRAEQMECLLSVKIPRLRKLHLAGFVLSPKDLRTFLKNHASTLRSIELSHLVFEGIGHLLRLLPLLVGESFHLEHIRLHNLYQDNLFAFTNEADPDFSETFDNGRGIIIHAGADGTVQFAPYIYTPRIRRGNLADHEYRLRLKQEFGVVLRE